MEEQPESADGGTERHPLAFHFDTAPRQLCGWAAPTHPDRLADDPVLTLMVGAVSLGTIRRDQPRPDVDAYLGHAGRPAGFAITDYGLGAYAVMARLGDVAVVTGGSGTSSVRHAIPRDRSGVPPEPLASRHRLGKALRLADIWFETNRDLSLRFEGDGTAGLRIDAYQCAADGGSLVGLLSDRPVSAGLAIVTAKLLNPFLPLLLILKDEGGGIGAIDIVPFPSLARGGLHAAERMMSGPGGDDLADMSTVSASLLRAMLLLRDERPDGALAAIDLDPATQTGLEPMLNDDLLAWITGFMDVAVTFGGADDANTGDRGFIREKLSRHDRALPRDGNRLLLPADAIPTISALVQAVPQGVAGMTIAGATGVVEWGRHGRIWSVWSPPANDWIEALQWREARRATPLLCLRGDHRSGGREPALAWPLALVLREKPPTVPRDAPFETAAELPLSLLRSGAMPDDAPLSVLILFDRAGTSPLPLLESLARQTHVGAVEPVVCCPLDGDDTIVRKALGTLFPTHDVVMMPAEAGRLEQIAAARDRLPHDTVLILDAATVLPDARTVATMLPMLACEQVQTVGCLIRSTQGAAVPVAAGYVAAGVDLRVTPGLMFDTIDPGVFGQVATYPVVAGAMAAMLTRRALLAGLEPHGSDPVRPEVDDLLLGLHALAQGGINLCTTIVSAYSSAPVPRGTRFTLTSPYRLPADLIARLIDAAVLVQKIR